ncbi:MAG: 16S rRNA (uracil(1498)-N(3))-methyltransferase [Acidimicrobiia bacterium]
MGRHQPHLLVPPPGPDGAIEVDVETRRHLEKVLRYPDGGSVTYTDGAGLLGNGAWEGASLVRGDERTLSRSGPVTVAVAPPHSSSRVRFLVEKLGELGIGRLLWLRTEHGQGKPPRPEKAGAWARAALEQSGGVWLMAIAGPVTIGELSGWGTPVFAERGGRQPYHLDDVADPVLCIGPEGGWAPAEIPEGAPRVHLGDPVLRVETAAIVGAALMLYGSGDG